MLDPTPYNFDAKRVDPQGLWEVYLNRGSKTDLQGNPLGDEEFIDTATIASMQRQVQAYPDATLLCFQNVDMSSTNCGQVLLIPFGPRNSMTLAMLEKCKQLRGRLPADFGPHLAFRNYLKAWLHNDDVPAWQQLLAEKLTTVQAAEQQKQQAEALVKQMAEEQKAAKAAKRLERFHINVAKQLKLKTGIDMKTLKPSPTGSIDKAFASHKTASEVADSLIKEFSLTRKSDGKAQKPAAP